MRRLLGGSSQPGARTTLQDTTSTLDKRSDYLGVKMEKLDNELRNIKVQISQSNSPQMKERLKQRAAHILRQKKMYMSQQSSLQNQSFGLEQIQFATESMQTNLDTVKAMKTVKKTLEKQYKRVNIDSVERLQDSMYDLMADAEELQEVLSRSYDVPEEMDDAEIMAELEGLGAEDELEGGNYLDELDDLTIPKRRDPTISQKDEFKQLEDELGA